MAQVKPGDQVKIHYIGKLEDGTVFDSTQGGDPLDIVVGQGNLIAGFEEAVMGMAPEESKTVTIPSDQAYGPRHPELVRVVNRSEVPPHIEPEENQQLHLSAEDGSQIPVVITNVTEDSITLDANHPLAGENLIFDLTLVEIVE
jgi:FKBP-type peptidyl-prolyl cis-trans isomerase 2